MTKITNGAAYFFILTSFALTSISIAGIWGLFEGDVVWKSFQSIGLIALACIIILAVDGFSARKTLSPEQVNENLKSIEGFVSIRTIAVTILIISVAVCVFLGLLSIWDLVKGGVLYKSLSTMATIGFFSLITALVCNQRETTMKGPSVQAQVSPIAPPQMVSPTA